MGIKQLYNDNLRKLPNEYGDVSVMKFIHFEGIINHTHKRKVFLLIYLNYDVVLATVFFTI